MDVQPILRVVETRRYWINRKLVVLSLGKKTFDIAEAVIEIINAYAKAKQASFAGFINTCEELRDISKQKHDINRLIIKWTTLQRILLSHFGNRHAHDRVIFGLFACGL